MESESHYVNGIKVTALCTNKEVEYYNDALASLPCISNDFEKILDSVDAVYLISKPEDHYSQIKTALQKGKHVLCEPPIALSVEKWQELNALAQEKNCILMDAIRTAYSTAYYRMLLLIKSGRIGKVYSVDASCSSLWDDNLTKEEMREKWNSINTWGPNAMLPIFQILGTGYIQKQITSHFLDHELHYDSFTKIAFVYPEAVASIKVGKGVKTEGELVISGTTGYIYVPAPWWKMDYFEIRREDPSQNKRYFYQLDGEGIRYELVSFLKAIQDGKKNYSYIDDSISQAFVCVIEDFYSGKDLFHI
jgi:choline-phosphate cytidylyltransferase